LGSQSVYSKCPRTYKLDVNGNLLSMPELSNRYYISLYRSKFWWGFLRNSCLNIPLALYWVPTISPVHPCHTFVVPN
jgi:hypothetical protein